MFNLKAVNLAVFADFLFEENFFKLGALHILEKTAADVYYLSFVVRRGFMADAVHLAVVDDNQVVRVQGVCHSLHDIFTVSV